MILGDCQQGRKKKAEDKNDEVQCTMPMANNLKLHTHLSKDYNYV